MTVEQLRQDLIRIFVMSKWRVHESVLDTVAPIAALTRYEVQQNPRLIFSIQWALNELSRGLINYQLWQEQMADAYMGD